MSRDGAGRGRVRTRCHSPLLRRRGEVPSGCCANPAPETRDAGSGAGRPVAPAAQSSAGTFPERLEQRGERRGVAAPSASPCSCARVRGWHALAPGQSWQQLTVAVAFSGASVASQAKQEAGRRERLGCAPPPWGCGHRRKGPRAPCRAWAHAALLRWDSWHSPSPIAGELRTELRAAKRSQSVWHVGLCLCTYPGCSCPGRAPAVAEPGPALQAALEQRSFLSLEAPTRDSASWCPRRRGIKSCRRGSPRTRSSRCLS